MRHFCSVDLRYLRNNLDKLMGERRCAIIAIWIYATGGFFNKLMVIKDVTFLLWGFTLLAEITFIS